MQAARMVLFLAEGSIMSFFIHNSSHSLHFALGDEMLLLPRVLRKTSWTQTCVVKTSGEPYTWEKRFTAMLSQRIEENGLWFINKHCWPTAAVLSTSNVVR